VLAERAKGVRDERPSTVVVSREDFACRSERKASREDSALLKKISLVRGEEGKGEVGSGRKRIELRVRTPVEGAIWPEPTLQIVSHLRDG